MSPLFRKRFQMNNSSENFSVRRVLFHNTGIRFAAQAVSMLVNLTSTFVLSRYLGVEGFGGLNYMFAFYYFFLVAQDMGIDVIAVRECSRNPDQAGRILGTMRAFKVLTSLVLVLTAWIIIGKVSFAPALKSALYLYALILPVLALEHPAVIFQVKLNAQYPSGIAILKSVANFIFLIGFVALGLGMTGYVLALVLSELAVMAASVYFSRRFVSLTLLPDWPLCFKILKSSGAIAAAGVFTALTNRVDFLMLERMTDLHQLGLYSAVYKVTNLLESLPLVMMATLYPVMSRYAEAENKDALRKLYQKCLLLLGGLALPMGIGVVLFARPIVELCFGAEFLQAAAGLQVLIWATVFLYPAISAGNLLISLGKEKSNLVINVFAALSNIVLNFFWIPRYGFVGAAAATAVSYFFILIFSLISARRALRQTAHD